MSVGAACWWTAHQVLPAQPAAGAALALALFAITFGLQLGLGHRVFERGRDDTAQNLAELSRTRNPVPILLVFYYHLVELFLAAGYRPGLARDLAAFTERERASWDDPAS